MHTLKHTKWRRTNETNLKRHTHTRREKKIVFMRQIECVGKKNTWKREWESMYAFLWNSNIDAIFWYLRLHPMFNQKYRHKNHKCGSTHISIPTTQMLLLCGISFVLLTPSISSRSLIWHANTIFEMERTFQSGLAIASLFFESVTVHQYNMYI